MIISVTIPGSPLQKTLSGGVSDPIAAGLTALVVINAVGAVTGHVFVGFGLVYGEIAGRTVSGHRDFSNYNSLFLVNASCVPCVCS